MPVVLLLRHAQSSYGDTDALSGLGREQAQAARRELGRRALRDPLLVSGTLPRQRETAALLGLGGARLDGRWDEYDHPGLLQRYPVGPAVAARGLQASLDVALAAWVADPGGGWASFRDGAGQALADVAGQGRDAVVVTSGGVLAAVCGALLRVGAEGVVALHRVVVNTSVSKVVVGRSGTSLVAFNDHAHLEGESRHLLTYR